MRAVLPISCGQQVSRSMGEVARRTTRPHLAAGTGATAPALAGDPQHDLVNPTG
jgi:hypothetical protein